MQDAHEFLIFLINHINEIIVGEQNAGPALTNSLVNSKSKTPEPDTTDAPAPTWINEIFQVIIRYHMYRVSIINVIITGCPYE